MTRKKERPSIPGQGRRPSNKSSNKSNSSAIIIDQNGIPDKSIVNNAEPEIRFSVVATTKGILTKRMRLKGGEVLKDSTSCRMVKGTIKTITSTPLMRLFTAFVSMTRLGWCQKPSCNRS